MADLIDRGELIAGIDKLMNSDVTREEHFGLRMARVKTVDAPTVDAVPVVRCKDCIFKREKREFGDLKCIILGMPMRFDNFCSYGEKNDNTNTEV